MKFKINDQVVQKFPNLIVKIPILTGFNNKPEESVKSEILNILRSAEESIRNKFESFEDAKSNEFVKPYLDIFKEFGANTDKVLPTHLAMMKRVIEGEHIPDINPIVNLYNAMSLKYVTPYGGEDLDTLYGDFELKFAEGNEHWMGINAKEGKSPKVGDLIWRDDYDVSTLSLNWRQCERTKSTENIHNGFFIMDGFADINEENITNSANEFVSLATKFLGGKAEILEISKDNPVAEIEFTTKSIAGVELPKVNVIAKQNQNNKKTEKPEYHFAEGSIQSQIQKIVFDTISKSFVSTLKLENINVESPKDPTHGDFATSVAMHLTRELGKNPREIGENIVNEIKSNQLFENVSIAGPGFINFKISNQAIFDKTKSIKLQLNDLEGKKYIFEFTDPNPFKEFHIGHLYSNSVGESFSRIHEAMGATVKRADFFGDVGMHVSKSIWGLMKKLEEDSLTIDDLEQKPLKDRIAYLGQSYAKGATAYKDDDAAKEEMKDINYVVFLAGQKYLIETQNWKPLVDYEKYIYGKDVDRDKIIDIYFRGKKWSLDYFEEIYKRVGTKFDFYYPESFVGEFGMQTVNEGLEKGVFEISDGAVIFDGEKYGLHKRVFRNSLGLPTYEAKDLGLAPSKYRDFQYDKSVVVTANEINEYFKVVLKALSLIHPELAEKTTHIGHGVVKLPEGKMSSRTGKIVTGESLIETAKAKALEIIRESGKISPEEEAEVAEIIAIGGIKFAFLRSAIGGDIVFSFEESISFEGNSGPYIQYTYARCKSILRNADKTFDESTINVDSLEEAEKNLMLELIKFDGIIVDSANNLSTHILCNYLFDLAQEFNTFYQKCKVVGSEFENRRLFLTSKTADVLARGLHLLGIKTVEKM